MKEHDRKDDTMTTVLGRAVTPDGIVDGGLSFEHGKITRVGPPRQNSGIVYDFGDALILPGFIDVHMHGLGRHDIYEAADMAAIAKMQCRFGTTGFLPTAASLSVERYLQFGRNVREAQATAGPESAEIIGAHFEGPFINPRSKAGMDADYLREISLDECRRYLDEAGDVLKLMTISPELDGGTDLIRLLRRHGVVVSLGHSRATVAQLYAAVETGLTQVCHLFNAFEREGNDPHWPWLKGPSVGLLDAILDCEKISCEVVCDLVHVRPEHVRLAAERLGPERFMAITDSLPGAGLPPDEYTMIDGRGFSTTDGAARLTSSGMLVGSVLTMNRAFGNLVDHCQIDHVTAAKYTSGNAARGLGLAGELGSIRPGRRACLAVLDADHNCLATFVDGNLAYCSNGQY
ncbi:MAG: N-acetylglucosamine-6-phosphate deacetylase [Planctomycetota bacterium]|nr:N-acetylglucosamine-6-phosphate deacetylase [Planctomycetota bacterium]